MNFLKSFSITASSNAILVIVAFLNNVIITRQIGAEGRGQYIVVTNLILLLTLFLGEGIRRSNTIIVGKDKTAISKLILINFIYSIFITILLLVIFFFKDIWQYFLPNISEIMFLLSLIVIVFAILWQAFQAVFLGLQNYYAFNLIQLIPTIATFIINIVGIYLFNFQIVEIIFSLLIASLLSLLFGLISFRRKLFIGNISSNISNKNFGLLSIKSTLSASFIFILLRGNVFFINFFLGAQEAGIYSIAYIFLDMTQKLPNIASPILISKTVSDFSNSAIMNTAKLVRVVLVINIIFILFLFIFGKLIIVLLFKSEFEESFNILLYLLPAILFFGCGAIIYAYYMSREYPTNIIWLNGIFAFISVILNIIFIPIYGLKISAFIISLTFISWTFVLSLYFIKETKITFSDLYFIKIEDILYLLKFSKLRNKN